MLARKALAGTAAAPKVYVEDVFSTWLFAGTSSGTSSNIVNGIDLSGQGGLVWMKNRSSAENHFLYDTARGNTVYVSSNTTTGNSSYTGVTFNADGFTQDVGFGSVNVASWTFRKAKKFFDVVTYTGNGSARTISHNLGSTPGCIIVKRTDTTGAWQVYHRANTAAPETDYLVLNTTAATADSDTRWNDTLPTSTVFSLGTDATVNANGATYVAYLFAHDAGGFGDSGSDSIIKCGSYTGNASTTGPTVTLDWEPQWILIKNANDANGPWYIWDNMRGLVVGGNDASLNPNYSDAESSFDYCDISATGFQVKSSGSYVNGNGNTIIYIAIRRGPMKTPTSGTSVFSPNAYTGTGAGQTYTTNFPVDMTITSRRSPSGANHEVYDRLRPWYAYLFTDTTAAEGTAFGTTNQWLVDRMDSVKWNSSDGFTNAASDTYCTWNFRRAPGFFDVVCYTGNNSSGESLDVTHNLGVAPELWIIKPRNDAKAWTVGSTSLTNQEYLNLNTNSAKLSDEPSIWGSTATYPTSTYFRVGPVNNVNYYTYNFVAYLFASVSGVSKIGTYTGNGSSVTVTTDFQPRFIMVKRTDSTGDWLVSDSARGLVAGSDPYLLLNSTAAEDTDEDWVDISSTSFTVNQTTNNANVNTGTYIYLAIA